MRIKVISDSTCDLTAQQLAAHNITITPLIIMKGDEEYLDGVTIQPADIFAYVAAGGDLCSTAARGMAVYEEVFSQYAKEYDGIVHISLGSAFSSSYQNACLAAESFENVRVIDSMNLSTGQGLVVLRACELAASGMTLDEIEGELNALTPRIEASFVMDQLSYMVKGGRCSSAAALGANLLNLKPCIEVRDGKMSVVKKYRGSYTKCLVSYAKDRLLNREDLEYGTVFVTHTPVEEEAAAAVLEVVKAQPFRNVYQSDAGCTVSCHCGPGTLGVLFIRK